MHPPVTEPHAPRTCGLLAGQDPDLLEVGAQLSHQLPPIVPASAVPREAGLELALLRELRLIFERLGRTALLDITCISVLTD
jgi:hypothetical protein